jgi:hypothetical protein
MMREKEAFNAGNNAEGQPRAMRTTLPVVIVDFKMTFQWDQSLK